MPKKQKQKARGARGRPSLYTPALAKRICDEIAIGHSLATIAKEAWSPSYRAMRLWIATNEVFMHDYVRAKEDMAERLADEIITIADDGSNDTYARDDGTGTTSEVVNHDNINRSRLRVDARKWVLSKLIPKKYGDRQHIEHSGTMSLAADMADARKRAREGDA